MSVSAPSSSVWSEMCGQEEMETTMRLGAAIISHSFPLHHCHHCQLRKCGTHTGDTGTGREEDGDTHTHTHREREVMVVKRG